MVLSSIAVILVRPQLAQNVGSIARVMGNFGLQDLRLISPLPQALNDTTYASARGFEKIIEKAQIYSTLPEAVGNLTFLYATTARTRNLKKDIILPKTIELFPSLGIVFGPENCGLNNEEISLCNQIIYIPTSADPLNIAQAVAIICYEIAQKTLNPEITLRKENELATSAELGMFFQHLENSLELRNFFQINEKRKVMMHNIRSIFTRALLTKQEVQTLRGIITSLTIYKPKNA